MKSIAIVTVAASLGLASLSLPALAQEQNHIKWSQLTKMLEDQGFVIRELDQNLDGFKAEVFDKDKQRLELRLDRQGNITRKRVDD